MSRALPLNERLIQQVCSVLAAATTLSQTGSDAALSVIRPSPKGSPDTDNQVIVAWAGERRVGSPDGNNTNNVDQQWIMQLQIEYNAKESERSATPIDTRLTIGCADIVAALMDPDNDAAFAALGQVSRWPGDPEPFATDATALIGRVIQNFFIRYQTLRTDPYTF